MNKIITISFFLNPINFQIFKKNGKHILFLVLQTRFKGHEIQIRDLSLHLIKQILNIHNALTLARISYSKLAY